MKNIFKNGAGKFPIVAACLLFAKTSLSQSCYPTSIIDNAHGNKIMIEYDDQFRLTAVSTSLGTYQTSYTVTTETTPTGSKKTFVLKESNVPADFSMKKATLEFDQGNRLRMVEAQIGTSMMASEKFVYNVRGQLIEVNTEERATDDHGKVTSDLSKTLYTYPNVQTKNPSEVKEYGTLNGTPGQLIKRYTLTYDDKKSIKNEFPFDIGIYKVYSENNILTSEIFEANQVVKQSYTYTYNDNGYPITCTYQFSGTANTDTFDYKCK